MSRARSSWVLRVGLVRNAHASTHLTTFVVAAVSTVVLTRLFLILSGYPQIGGGGLHIAHMLPGGLLMLVALFLLMSYVGPVVRPVAALLGGIGFGLFIDEIGKFVTSDNDYFFQPSFAIMYAVFAAIVLAMHVIHNVRPLDPRERLANTVDQAVEGVAGGLSKHRRAEARRNLDVVDPAYPLRVETWTLVDACARNEVELPPLVERVRGAVVRVFEELVTRPWAVPVMTVVLALKIVLTHDIAGVVVRIADGQLLTVPVIGVAGGTLAAAFLLVRGAMLVRDESRRDLAMQAFLVSLLVSLLICRVFEFAWRELGAGIGLLLDLVLLGLVAAERERLRQVGDRLDNRAQVDPSGSGPAGIDER